MYVVADLVSTQARAALVLSCLYPVSSLVNNKQVKRGFGEGQMSSGQSLTIQQHTPPGIYICSVALPWVSGTSLRVAIRCHSDG